jgi:hypothetical protein
MQHQLQQMARYRTYKMLNFISPLILGRFVLVEHKHRNPYFEILLMTNQQLLTDFPPIIATEQIVIQTEVLFR